MVSFGDGQRGHFGDERLGRVSEGGLGGVSSASPADEQEPQGAVGLDTSTSDEIALDEVPLA